MLFGLVAVFAVPSILKVLISTRRSNSIFTAYRRYLSTILHTRVFTPCLENVPEYFEHSARVMLDGLWSINPTIDVDANLWWCRYLADVPGPAVAGLPDLSPRKLYYKDYNSVESSPEYKQLNFKSKTKLYLNYLYVSLYTCCLGRWYFNVNFKFSLFLMRYFPYVAFFRFGIKSSIVNVFVEDVKDDT
ncbi:Uncharacterized protein OBRU01_15735, partial [Operophtera brumata]